MWKYGKGQTEKLKTETEANNQTVRYYKSSNLEEPINSERVAKPGSRQSRYRKSGHPRRENGENRLRSGNEVFAP